MRPTTTARLALALVGTLGLAARAPADELITAGTNLVRATLPVGPALATLPLDAPIRALAVLDDGRLVGIVASQDSPDISLVEVGDDGTTAEIGVFQVEALETPVDLATDAFGDLYLLTAGFYWNPPEGWSSLYRLSSTTGAVQEAGRVDRELAAIARARRGSLWAVGDKLYELDVASRTTRPASLEIRPSLVPLGADVDSTGALWVVQACSVCSPPVTVVERLDPASGSTSFAPALTHAANATALAIRRDCVETSSRRCLQGGRFRVETTWSGPDGVGGAAKASPARSADTALFSFFDPANWELLVRVLDACEEDGHFWVFASASTTVATRLTVTDLETGRTASYENPLGQVARAITDTTTFDVCP